MPVTTEVIKRLTIEAKANGFDEVRRQIEGLSVAQKKTGESALSVERQVESLIRRLDPLGKAERDLAAGSRVLANALNQGAIGIDQAARASVALSANYDRAVQSVNRSTAVVGLNRAAMTNLGYQINDIATGLLTGQSPFMIMAQQGGQVVQVLQTSQGGVGAVVKQLGSSIAGLLTPIRLASGGFLAFGAAAFAAFSSAGSEAAALTRVLNGVGAASGQSVTSLRAIAEASRNGLSIGAATSAAGAYAGAGLNASQIANLTGSTRQFSRAFGLDTGQASEMLARMFKDPANGARELSEKFGTLTQRSQDQVSRALAQADIERARNTLMQEFNRALANTNSKMSAFQTVWERLSVASSNLWTKFGRYIEGKIDPTDQQQLLSLVQQRAQAERSYNSLPSFMQTADRFSKIDAYDKKIEAIMDRMDASAKKRLDLEQEQKRVAEERIREGYIKQLTPEIQQFKQLQDVAKALEGMRSPGEEAALALERARVKLAAFLTPIQELLLNSQLTVSATVAQTGSARTAVDMLRAYIDAIKQTGSAAHAAAAAEAERARALAESTRRSLDLQREARNSAELVGLRPAERERKQLEQRFRDYNRENDLGLAAPLFNSLKAGADATGVKLLGFGTALDQAGNAVASFMRSINQSARSILSGQAGLGQTVGIRQFARGEAGGAPNTDLGRTRGLNEEFLSRLQKLNDALGGAAFTVTSGFRSFEEQARLRAAKPHLAAPPGSSLHEVGVAADLKFASKALQTLAHNRASEFGLRFPMLNPSRKYEPWHIEAAEGRRLGSGGGSTALDTQAIKANTDAVNDNNKARDQASQASLRKSLVSSQETQFIMSSENALRQQEAALRSQVSTFGQSVQAVAAATEKRRLLTEAESQGLTVTSSLMQAIDQQSQRYGANAAAQEQLTQALRDYNDIRGATGDALNSFASTFARTRNAADALKSAVESLIQALIRMATNRLLMSLFGNSAGSGGLLSGLLGGALGLGGGGGTGGVYAYGGVMGSSGDMPLRRYAAGGVARGAQISMFGEGAYPEAYVPLFDGRHIPVKMQQSPGGQGGGQANTFINIQNNTPAQVRSEKSRGPNGEQMLKFIIEEVKNSMASGEFDMSMRGRYGRLPVGIAR